MLTRSLLGDRRIRIQDIEIGEPACALGTVSEHWDSEDSIPRNNRRFRPQVTNAFIVLCGEELWVHRGFHLRRKKIQRAAVKKGAWLRVLALPTKDAVLPVDGAKDEKDEKRVLVAKIVIVLGLPRKTLESMADAKGRIPL